MIDMEPGTSLDTDLVHESVVDGHAAARVLATKLPNLSVEDMLALALDRDYEVTRALATRPGLPTEVTKRLMLSLDQETLNLVAKHNLPSCAVHEILDTKPSAVVLQTLAKAQELSHIDMLRIMKTSDSQVRRVLGSRGDLTPEAARLLSKYVDNTIAIALVNNPRTPDDVINGLACDLQRRIKRASGLALAKQLAQHDRLTPDSMVALAKNSNRQVNLVLASREDLPREAIAILVNFIGGDVRTLMAMRKDLSPDEVASLVHDRDDQVRCAIASFPQMPDYLVVLLAQDDIDQVRSVVAQRDHLPLLAIHLLAIYASPKTREALAHRHDMPLDYYIDVVYG